MGRGRKRTEPKAERRGARAQHLVDIVMPIFGEWNIAERAVKAVAGAAVGLSGGYRLYVLDNGTPAFQSAQGGLVTPREQSGRLRELLRPEDRFLRVEQNLGYPGGLNYLVGHGSAPLILVLTADVVLDPGAISILARDMDDPKVGVAAPLLTFPRDDSASGPPGRVQSAGIAFDIRGRPRHIFIGWSPDSPRVAVRRDMAAVTGACFITRRSLWREVGGLAEVYGAGTFEDIEYCLAVRSRGHIVLLDPMARGSHYVGASIRHGANRGGFAIPLNEAVFRGRNARLLAWDEWRYY